MFTNFSPVSCDVLVIGSGLSGLSAAVEAARAGKKTIVVSKNHPLKSHSAAAAGGINAALTAEDIDLHCEETITAGCGLCDRHAVEILCRSATDVIEKFRQYGTPFRLNENSEPEGRPFGAMSTPRTRFVGDYTGAALMQTIFEQAGKVGVRFEYDIFLTDLIKDGSRIAGACGIRFQTGTVEIFSAGAVILATGGAGALFAVNSNGNGSTGDGYAMALRTGIPLKNWELIQFHPTGLYPSGLLVSEAARGEGAVLRNKEKEAFMFRYHEKGDLAPRDVVTRAILTEIKCGRGFGRKGDFILLDCRTISPERLEERLPEICNLTKTMLHIHPSTHLIPVIPTAHYFMGGVATDTEGHVLDGIGFAIPGLFAAGECSWTGVHGANRVGGNSLLEAAVFGRRAGKTAAAEATSTSPDPNDALRMLNARLELPTIASDTDENGKIPTPLECRQELKEILSTFCGAVHTTIRHKQGTTRLSLLERRFRKYKFRLPVEHSCNTELKDWLETDNMLLLGAALLTASEERSESLGAFFREDQIYAGGSPYHTLTEYRKGHFSAERRPL